MKHAVQYPLGSSPAGLGTRTAEFVRAAEDAGFAAVCFTEHPAPPAAWMAAGGHATLDPYVALAFCAAVTSRIRLMTSVTVPAYRNPLLWTKSVFSLDALSDGRVTLSCGAGYLRSEFGALGVDFDQRNDLFDEALDVLAAGWACPEGFDPQGQGFRAKSTALLPGPVQPRPPVWIGGNSRAARERVVRHGVGWAPLMADEALAGVSRTAAITGFPALAVLVADLRERLLAAGRDPQEVDVCVQSPTAGSLASAELGVVYDAERCRTWAASAGDAGASWVTVTLDTGDAREDLRLLERYGADVIVG